MLWSYRSNVTLTLLWGEVFCRRTTVMSGSLMPRTDRCCLPHPTLVQREWPWRLKLTSLSPFVWDSTEHFTHLKQQKRCIRFLIESALIGQLVHCVVIGTLDIMWHLTLHNPQPSWIDHHHDGVYCPPLVTGSTAKFNKCVSVTSQTRVH